jgi:transcriptional regulator with XRE-family HTH domain
MQKKHPILVELGKNIVAIRKKLGLSQEALALEAGLDRTYVGGIERGERNVAVLNLYRIAKTLNIKPARLFRGIEPTEIDLTE